MRKTIILFFTILSVSLSFTSCDGEGLFYTIENEELVEDNNMANIKFADVIVTDSYYIARGVKLWYRTIDGTGWSIIDRSGDYLTSMAYYQNKIYYTERDGNNSYLYELDIETDGPDGSALIHTVTPSSGDYTWLQLFADPDGDRLFMNAVEYELDDDGDPTTIASSELYFTNSILSTDISTDFGTSVFTVQDDGSGDYWPLESEGIAFGTGDTAWLIFNDVDPDDDLEEGGLLYYTTDNFDTDETDISTYIGDDYYNSIYYASTAVSDWLLLSTRTDWSASDASLFYVLGADSNGDNWTEIEEDDDGDVSLFTGFAYNSANPDYIMGCTNNDYYTSGEGYVLIKATETDSLSVEDDEDDMADEDNYESSDLEDSTVYAMTYDTTGIDTTGDFILVAGTSTGVWTYDDDTREWTQE